jgi:malate dehydrogenase (oxaloacetate-decarboxylating)(NADP+)
MVRLITNRAKSQTNCFLRKQIIGCLKAAQIVWEEGIGFPILLGNKEIILLKEEIGFDADVPIIDPKIKEEEARRNKFANTWSSRQRRGISFWMLKTNARKKLFCSNDGQ